MAGDTVSIRLTLDDKRLIEELRKVGGAFQGLGDKVDGVGKSTKQAADAARSGAGVFKGLVTFELIKKIGSFADETLRAANEMKGLSAGAKDAAANYVAATDNLKEMGQTAIFAFAEGLGPALEVLKVASEEAVGYWKSFFGIGIEGKDQAYTDAINASSEALGKVGDIRAEIAKLQKEIAAKGGVGTFIEEDRLALLKQQLKNAEATFQYYKDQERGARKDLQQLIDEMKARSKKTASSAGGTPTATKSEIKPIDIVNEEYLRVKETTEAIKNLRKTADADFMNLITKGGKEAFNVAIASQDALRIAGIEAGFGARQKEFLDILAKGEEAGPGRVVDFAGRGGQGSITNEMGKAQSDARIAREDAVAARMKELRDLARQEEIDYFEKQGAEQDERFEMQYEGYRDLQEKIRAEDQKTADMRNAHLQGIQDMFAAQATAIGGISELLATTDRKDRARRLQWKTAAIAEASLNTAVGVTKAYAQGGVLGLLTGIGVAAAGAAQIAIIKNQKFAEGGIVKGPTVGDRVPIQANGREMVLTQEQQANLFSMIQGGGSNAGPTINYAPVIQTSNAAAVKQMLRENKGEFESFIRTALSNPSFARRGAFA